MCGYTMSINSHAHKGQSNFRMSTILLRLLYPIVFPAVERLDNKLRESTLANHLRLFEISWRPFQDRLYRKFRGSILGRGCNQTVHGYKGKIISNNNIYLSFLLGMKLIDKGGFYEEGFNYHAGA